MEKTEKRNEIIHIFRKYARLGLDDHDLNPIQTYKKIELCCISRRARLDMMAVFDMLRLLELSGDADTLEAVRYVYFEGKTFRLTKAEISSRVSHVANKTYCDNRTVYRRLEKARALYEKIRDKEGLILDGPYCDKYV